MTEGPNPELLAQAEGFPQRDLPFPGFTPTGKYAIDAQQEQLRRLRAERDVVEDREAFYVACLMQLIAESREATGNLAAELSVTRNRLAMVDGYLAKSDPNYEGLDKLIATLEDPQPDAEQPLVGTPSTNGHAPLKVDLEELRKP